MYFEKESPPPTAFYSPKWHAHRTNTKRQRAIIILGVIILCLTSLGLLRHYSAVPPRREVHDLKVLDDVSDNPLYQQERVDSMQQRPLPEDADTNRQGPRMEV